MIDASDRLYMDACTIAFDVIDAAVVDVVEESFNNLRLSSLSHATRIISRDSPGNNP